MTNSTKPAKPHQDWPLFAHNNGQWAKKVRGKIHFFGVWADPQAALSKWVEQKDALLAGHKPHGKDVITLGAMCDRFMATKKARLDAGEIAKSTHLAYHKICEELCSAFGWSRCPADLQPDDFESLRVAWSRRWGPVRLGAEIVRARVVFNYAYKNGLLATPMRYGEGFKGPSRKTIRLARAAKGAKMFEADEMRRILAAAKQPMKSMLLLAINCGFGNSDLAQLRTGATNLHTGWIDYPRPKTGVARRCPLWLETVKAIREWLAVRPAAKSEMDASRVFVTRHGNSWNNQPDAITKQCRKLLDSLGINGHRNFYAIRHTFETVAGRTQDQAAVNAIMGHDDGSMANVYREEQISDTRLQAVVAAVRVWLDAAPRQ